MLTFYPYRIKKELSKGKPVLSDQLYHLTDPPEFLLQQKNVATERKAHKRSHIIKRTSPFLLVALFLPVAFIFLFVTHGTINKLLLFFLFTCLEINILFVDFALWNYYEGKKVLRIWLIEMFLILISVYFIRNKLF